MVAVYFGIISREGVIEACGCQKQSSPVGQDNSQRKEQKDMRHQEARLQIRYT